MQTRRSFLEWLAAAAIQVDRLERCGPVQRLLVLGGGLAGMCRPMNSRRKATGPPFWKLSSAPADASRCAKASRLFAADRFADLMDHDERRTGRIA